MWKERPFPEGLTCEEDKHKFSCHILEGFFGCGAMERPHKELKGGRHLVHTLGMIWRLLAPQTNGDCLGFIFNKYFSWTNFQVSKSRSLCFGMPMALICWKKGQSFDHFTFFIAWELHWEQNILEKGCWPSSHSTLLY